MEIDPLAVTAGPSVSYAITEADVDSYINAAGEFFDELIG